MRVELEIIRENVYVQGPEDKVKDIILRIHSIGSQLYKSVHEILFPDFPCRVHLMKIKVSERYFQLIVTSKIEMFP